MVFFKLVNEIEGNFFFAVSKRAILFVLTFINEAVRAQLSSILVWMIKLLHTSVTVETCIALRTLLFLSDEAAELCFVCPRGSSSVFIVLVVVNTFS